jgi:hypothetical protein
LLGSTGENEVFESTLIVAHATRGVIINANGEQVQVEASSGRVTTGSISLEGDGAMGRPGQERVAEEVEPLDDGAEAPLNATTNLVGFP